MRIAAVRVDPNLDRNHYARLLAYISPEKRNRLPRFRQDNDFNLGLIAEILVRTMLGEELGIANEQIRIEADPNGKPRLEGMPDYHFNLTHSGQWVACVTDREQTGIDIERVIELGGDIAGRFFTHKECEYLNRLSGEMRTRAFFSIVDVEGKLYESRRQRDEDWAAIRSALCSIMRMRSLLLR